jgi:hypothetical protein
MLGQVLRRLRPAAAAAEVARGYSAAAKEVRRRSTETYLPFRLTVWRRGGCVGIRRHVNRNCVVLFVDWRLECRPGVGGLSGGDVWMRV